MILIPYVDSLAPLVAIRLLQGVAEAAFFVASSRCSPTSRPRPVGGGAELQLAGLYLGIAFGPAFAELLIENLDYSTAWYGATALSVAAGAGAHHRRAGA